MPIAPGTRLGPYEVVAALAAGGMGEIYRARDSRLARDVAVKVLPENLATNPDARARFEREARAVAALSHANILAIHDIGDHGGLAYAVMELLEGETLRKRLARHYPTWNEAAEIAASVADGVGSAHDKGIVHRDLKPENLFLTADGRVKILDFGLARRVDAPSAATDMTEPGTVLGTVSYMSPEQVRGVTAEAASDLFSLGCVLYEMLTGRRPFDRPTVADTMAAILHDSPTSIGESGKQVPLELAQIVMRCLAKKPSERPRSARELGADLRAVVNRRTSPLTAPADAIDSLAVLPFANAGDNPDTEYLSDGIAENLMNNLAQIPHLRVVPRSRAFRYKGQSIDVKKVGRQLKVRALLTGRVLKRDDVLNVQVELVDAVSEAQLWGERFHRKVTDIFVVEDEITRQIADKLKLKLSGQDHARILKRHTHDTGAYHLYLKGRYHWNKRTADGLRKALEHFQKAIEQDPSYATAYAGLADGYLVLPFFAPIAPRSAFERGKAAALKALEIDDELSEAYTALGLLQACVDWDWAGAERSLQRAIALKPDYWLAHNHYAILLSALGRHDEAMREVRRGLELEPLAVTASHHFAWVAIRARLYDEAIDQCRRAIEMEPAFSMGHQWLGLAYALKSMTDEAIAAVQTAHRIAGNNVAAFELARTLAAAGRPLEARRLLASIGSGGGAGYVEPFGFAIVHAALGEIDQAFERLNQGVQDRSGFLACFVNGDPRLDALADDPRMYALKHRLGLPAAAT